MLATPPSPKDAPFPRVLTGDAFPTYVSRALPEGGMFPMLSARVAARAGWTHALRHAPWPRVERALSDGTFDLARHRESPRESRRRNREGVG